MGLSEYARGWMEAVNIFDVLGATVDDFELYGLVNSACT